MNKYQKLINQITKDDMKKGFYKNFLGTNFKRHRRVIRRCISTRSLLELKRYRDFNKGIQI